MMRHVRFVRMSDVATIFGLFNFAESIATNRAQRDKENYERVYNATRAVMDLRGMSPTANPLIWQFTFLAFKVILFSDLELYHLPSLYKRHSREFAWALRTIRDEETRQELMEVATLSSYQFRNEVGPTIRLLDECALHTAFRKLCGGLSMREMADQKLCIILEGEGCPRLVVQFVGILLINEVIQFVEREKKPIELFVDELFNFGLATPELALAINSLQKYGFSCFLATQTLKGSDELIDDLLSNIQTHWIHRNSDRTTIDAYARLLTHAGYVPNRAIPGGSMAADPMMTPQQWMTIVAGEIAKLQTGSFIRYKHGNIQRVVVPKGSIPWESRTSSTSRWEKVKKRIIAENVRHPEFQPWTWMEPPPIQMSGFERCSS